MRKRVQKLLKHLPPRVFTAVVVATILWLTLAPEPLGQDNVPAIPGLDKLAHFMMFGGLTVAICTDLWLLHKPLSRYLLAVICAVSLFGGTIEVAQESMGLGRGAEWVDWLADTAGALFWGWLAVRFFKS